MQESISPQSVQQQETSAERQCSGNMIAKGSCFSQTYKLSLPVTLGELHNLSLLLFPHLLTKYANIYLVEQIKTDLRIKSFNTWVQENLKYIYFFFPCSEKPSSSHLCFSSVLCIFFIAHAKYFWLPNVQQLFPTQRNCLQHQLYVQNFNLFLTLSTHRQRTHRLSLSPISLSPPHSRCQSQVGSPQITHNFSLIWLHIRGSYDPLPQV